MDCFSQKTAWSHFGTPSFKVTQFTNNSISSGNNTSGNFIDPTTNATITEYVGMNQQFDINGKVIFTVISTFENIFFYNNKNELLDLILGKMSPEITIIPVKDGVVYHILAGDSCYSFNLASNEIVPEYKYGTVNFLSSLSTKQFGIQAAKTISNSNCTKKYLLYSISGNPPGYTGRYINVLEVIIDENLNCTINNIDNYNISNVHSGATNFSYNHCEMELSPDGSKLAVVEKDQILIYNINTSNYKISGLYDSYRFNPSGSNNFLAGIEFYDNNNLYMTIYDSYNSTNNLRGIYHWNFSNTSTPSKLSSTEDFSKSMIEKGKNGKLYTLKSDGVYEININTGQVNLSQSIVGGIVKRGDIYKYHYLNIPSYVDNQIYYLPDQLDNEINENLDLDEVVSSFTFLPGPSFSSYNWNNSNHGFTKKGSGRVIVLNEIKVQNTVVANLDGMTIEFWKDAKMNIYPGASVNLLGTDLKGVGCSSMWEGVRLLKSNVNSVNRFTMKKNQTGKTSSISDALIGIKTISFLNRIEIKEESNFFANEIHISTNNAVASRTTIINSIFNGNIALKDQTKGLKNGYSDSKNRTKIGVQIINSQVTIGDITNLTNKNIIDGGQLGLQAIGSSVVLHNAEVKGQKSYGFEYNANNNPNKTLIVQKCNFHDLFRGIRIGNKTKKTEIYENAFLNTSGYAIEYVSNPGGELIIGSNSNPSFGNTFNNCNWSAIQSFDNSSFTIYSNNQVSGSKIEIWNNQISNHLYAAGISIGEPTNPSRSYVSLKIENNQIGQGLPIGQGILIKQINGANPANPLDRLNRGSNYYKADFLVKNNNVQFSNSVNAFYRGIWTENSGNLNFLSNSVQVIGSGDWRPTAIRISDGRNNLVAENILRAGNGLQVTGNVIFSNYYCNTLDNCVNGIQLGWNTLRNSVTMPNTPHSDLTIHGHKYSSANYYGRPNIFTNSIAWGSDINVYNQAIDRNQWDFTNGNIPRISYLFPSTAFPNGIIHNRSRKDMCIISSTDSSELYLDSQFVDYQSEQNPVRKWKLMYDIVRDNSSSNSTQQIDNQPIISLVNIEKTIESRDFSLAANQLNSFIPSNSIESSFKTVYSIWVNNQIQSSFHYCGINNTIQDTIWMDSINYITDSLSNDTFYTCLKTSILSDSLVAVLSSIASQDATLVNPAAYPARAILWATNHLLFEDSPLNNFPNISGKIDALCIGFQNCSVSINTNNGLNTGISTISDSSGLYFFDGNQLKNLDSNLQYQLFVQFPDSSSLTSTIDNWKDLAYSSPINFNCVSPAPNPNQTKYISNLESVILFPNPSNGNFELSNLPNKWYIALYNISGNKIMDKIGMEESVKINLNLSPGIYIIKVISSDDGEETHIKFLVK